MRHEEPAFTDLRAWARETRSRAAALSTDAVARRRQAEELCERLAESLIRFDGRPFGARGEGFLLRLGRLRPLVRLARHDVRRWLEEARLPAELVDDVTLACSEACANAVEHPREPTRQLVEIEGRRSADEIELRVRDFGCWSERAPSDLRGRGLGMIRQLVDSLEVLRRGDGTVVVMRRSLDAR
ncbi:MAG TPA: ATP-binding protein [Gaiellaceae bacterium]|nr:ATP-binding protein [Gaiellaceae bacterium]